MDSIIFENVTKSFKLKKHHGIKGKIDNLISEEEDQKITAIDNISFNFKQGEMIGVIGLNGSGKTTLLRLMAGVYQPDFGSITVNGRLAPLLQIGIGFHDELDAVENIVLYGQLLSLSKADISSKIDAILEFSELERFASMKLKHFSTGMRARLAFATAIQVNPDILLVDEILAVGDIKFRQSSLNEFLKFKERGKTIVYSSHNLGMISQHCDKVLFLDEGKLVKEGDPLQVIEEYKKFAAKSS